MDLNPFALGLGEDPSTNVFFFNMFMDVNGDGLSDWITWKGDNNHLWLSVNAGGAFGSWQDLGADSALPERRVPYAQVPHDPAEQEFVYYPRHAHAFRQYDYDADGRSELLVPESIAVPACVELLAVNPQIRCGDAIYNPIRADGAGLVSMDDLGRKDDNIFNFAAVKIEETSPGVFTARREATDLYAAGNHSAVLDVFANGLTDIVFEFDESYTSTYYQWEQRTGKMADLERSIYVNRNKGSALSSSNRRYLPTDMLATATNGLGYYDNFEYRPLSSGAADEGGKPLYEPDFDYLATLSANDQKAHMHFTSSMYVVSQHRFSHGESLGAGNGTRRTTYRYRGAMLNREGRGFQGFRTVIAEDRTDNLITRSDFHQV